MKISLFAAVIVLLWLMPAAAPCDVRPDCVHVSRACSQAMHKRAIQSHAYRVMIEAGIMGDFKMLVYLLPDKKIIGYKVLQGINPAFDTVITNHIHALDFVIHDSCTHHQTDTLVASYRYSIEFP